MRTILFSATWCTSCSQLKPVLFRENLNYEEMNIEIKENADFAKSFGVRKLPTLIKLDASGNLVDKLVGKVDVDSIRAFK